MSPDFTQSAPELAGSLIGWTLSVGTNGKVCAGIINEVEAYTAADPASHSYPGLTFRNSAMFEAPGTIYIYRIYGIHHCLNFVCGNQDGQAVLIRSVVPSKGLRLMRQRRGDVGMGQLSDGPAKLFQALGLDPQWNGKHLSQLPVLLRSPKSKVQVRSGPRIGISKAVDMPWRFYAPSEEFIN